MNRELTQKAGIITAIVSIVAAFLYFFYWIRLARQGSLLPIDFSAFYTGAKIVADGKGDALYNFTIQSSYQLSILGQLPLNGNLLPFVNPPHFAVILLPLAYLSIETAYLVWMSLQLLLVVVLVIQCWSLSRGTAWYERVLLLAGLISLPMLFVVLYKGQLSLIVLLCLLLWAEAFKKGNDRRMAGWLLISAFKPQFLVLPLLILILARKWKALGLFALGVGLICIGSILIVGSSSLTDFISMARFVETSFDHKIIYPTFMYNFKGFLTLLLGIQPNRIMLLSRVAFMISLLVTVLLWKGKPDSNEEFFDLKLALSALLSVFFTSHLYYYDTLLLIMPALYFYSHLKERREAKLRWVFLTTLPLCPLLFLESAWFSIGEASVRWPVVIMISWFIWMAILLGKNNRMKQPKPGG